MEEALAEGRITVRFFAELDFLNGFFKVLQAWLLNDLASWSL
jgi:hypothetical protein